MGGLGCDEDNECDVIGLGNDRIMLLVMREREMRDNEGVDRRLERFRGEIVKWELDDWV